MSNSSYPVIDLFAGPGGLGEGFSSLVSQNKYSFVTLASIERDPFAHKTLLLRHFFKSFDPYNSPKEYYEYLAGRISFDAFEELYPEQWLEACNSALRISLGEESHEEVNKLISKN